LEHIYPDKLLDVLCHLHRALRPGGKLTIATVDLEGIYRHRFLADDNGSAWEAALFGEVNSTDHPMAAHRNCFTYSKLAKLIIEAGFSFAQPWRTEDYPEIHALNDYARSCSLVTCFVEAHRA
jgi:predicted SAM-dependent methyltransferase